MKRFIKSYLAALFWAAFILLLCGLPGEDLPNIDFWEINIEDKLAHLFVFAVLAVLLVRSSTAFFKERMSLRMAVNLAVIGVLYGGLTELLQGWVFPSRFSSLSDFIADAIGAILGTVFAFYYFVKRKE